MHGDLAGAGGLNPMGSDTPSRMEYKPGTNHSVSISGEDEAELRRYWDGLAAGGTVETPLERAAWGDSFGMCVDKFGVKWLVNITFGHLRGTIGADRGRLPGPPGIAQDEPSGGAEGCLARLGVPALGRIPTLPRFLGRANPERPGHRSLRPRRCARVSGASRREGLGVVATLPSSPSRSRASRYRSMWSRSLR